MPKKCMNQSPKDALNYPIQGQLGLLDWVTVVSPPSTVKLLIGIKVHHNMSGTLVLSITFEGAPCDANLEILNF